MAFLMSMNLEILYKAGEDNKVADCLSREVDHDLVIHPVNHEITIGQESEQKILNIKHQLTTPNSVISKLQIDDWFCGPILNFLKNNILPVNVYELNYVRSVQVSSKVNY